MQIVFANVKSEPIGAPIVIKGSRRRFDRLVKAATADLHAPFVASLHNPGSPLACTKETVRVRPKAIPKGLSADARREWEDRLWRNTIVTRDQTILITILPQGGRGGGAGKIALTIASIALMAFAGPLAGAAAVQRPNEDLHPEAGAVGQEMHPRPRIGRDRGHRVGGARQARMDRDQRGQGREHPGRLPARRLGQD